MEKVGWSLKSAWKTIIRLVKVLPVPISIGALLISYASYNLSAHSEDAKVKVEQDKQQRNFERALRNALLVASQQARVLSGLKVPVVLLNSTEKNPSIPAIRGGGNAAAATIISKFDELDVALRISMVDMAVAVDAGPSRATDDRTLYKSFEAYWMTRCSDVYKYTEATPVAERFKDRAREPFDQLAKSAPAVWDNEDCKYAMAKLLQ